MFSVVRYLISIIVHLVMLAIGGFLTFAGATSLLTVLSLQTLFGFRPVESEPSLGEWLFEIPDMASLWFADLTPWLITGGYLVFGLPLVFFGARGIVRRVQRGLPTEEDGIAHSSAGRIGQLLLYGIGILFGLSGVVFGAIEIAGPAQLYLSGERGVAVIELEWNATQTEDKSDTGFFVAYLFDTADGETIRASTQAPVAFVRKTEDGDRVPVIYSAADPSVNLLPDTYDVESLAGFFAFRFFLIGFGLWGIRRTLRTDRKMPDPPASSGPVHRLRRQTGVGGRAPAG